MNLFEEQGLRMLYDGVLPLALGSFIYLACTCDPLLVKTSLDGRFVLKMRVITR